jgi:hypothetical protein
MLTLAQALIPASQPLAAVSSRQRWIAERARLVPATIEELTVELNKLLDLPWPRIPSGWALYLDMLARLPLDVLRDAIAAHLADPERGRFFPLPADILRHAEPEMRARQQVADHHRAAAEAIEEPAPARDPPMTDEEIQAVYDKHGVSRRPSQPRGIVEERARPKPLSELLAAPRAVDVDPVHRARCEAWCKELGVSPEEAGMG